jgi:hypothetical protein
MKKISKLVYTALFIFMLSLVPETNIFAQTEDLDDLNNGGSDTPIDGGLSLLLAAGVGYGVKKVRDSRKKNAEFKDGTIEK